jgi:hypothetical protein
MIDASAVIAVAETMLNTKSWSKVTVKNVRESVMNTNFTMLKSVSAFADSAREERAMTDEYRSYVFK